MQAGGMPRDHWVHSSVLKPAGGTFLQSLLPMALLSSAGPSWTNEDFPHNLSRAGGDAVHLMYHWTQSPHGLTEHILITQGGKSILQITVLCLALQELFIPLTAACSSFSFSLEHMKRCTDKLGNPSPSH